MATVNTSCETRITRRTSARCRCTQAGPRQQVSSRLLDVHAASAVLYIVEHAISPATMAEPFVARPLPHGGSSRPR